jgi:hypothetical protein
LVSSSFGHWAERSNEEEESEYESEREDMREDMMVLKGEIIYVPTMHGLITCDKRAVVV